MADGVLTASASPDCSTGSSVTAFFVAVAFFAVFEADLVAAFFLGATAFFVAAAFLGAAVLVAVVVFAGAIFFGAGAGVADLAFLVFGSSADTSEALRLVVVDLVVVVADPLVAEGLAAFVDSAAAVDVFDFVVVAGFAAGAAFLGGMLTVLILPLL